MVKTFLNIQCNIFLSILRFALCPNNKPTVAGAVLKNTFDTDYVTHSSFVEIFWNHLHSQTVRARELKFPEKVHLPPPVMWHVSYVIYHVSHVTQFVFSFLYKVVKLVIGGSFINRATPSSFFSIKLFWNIWIIIRDLKQISKNSSMDKYYQTSCFSPERMGMHVCFPQFFFWQRPRPQWWWGLAQGRWGSEPPG